jgi:hypothetical protein
MGRLWRIPGSNLLAWNLEQCEELVLIAGYEEIRPFLSTPEQRWAADFEQHYFVTGDAILARTIDEQINPVRRRKELPLLEFQQTDVSEYSRTNNKKLRAERRCETRQGFVDASSASRIAMVNHARAEMQGLLPPHRTLEQYEMFQRDSEPAMNTVEVVNRVGALRKTRTPHHPSPATLDFAMAKRLLAITKNPDQRSAIVGAMSGDDALSAAEETDDEALRELLIGRALPLILPKT